MINNVKPVNTPDDTKGIKFRVMTTPIYIGLFQSLGSNAVPMPWGEVFTAVQQKVIDGLEIPIPVIYANKYYEVAKYLSLTGHTYSPLIFMCSEQRWKKFSAEEKAIIKKAAIEASAFNRNALKGINDDILKKISAAGMVVNRSPTRSPSRTPSNRCTKFEGDIGKDVSTLIKARDAASK
jgi:TRAP-type C4-dicarboxylate transport system substrate-binding protein